MKNLKISTQLLISFVITFTVIAIFAYSFIDENFEKSKKAEQTQLMIETLKGAKALVHEVQKERGYSAGYIGSKGGKFTDELKAQRLSSDEKFEAYLAIAEVSKNKIENENVKFLIEEIETKMNVVFSKGRDMTNDFAPAAAVVKIYIQAISSTLRLVDRTNELSADQKLFSLIQMYKNLGEAKEKSGIMRAVMANTFGNDTVRLAVYDNLRLLRSQFDFYLDEFKYYSAKDYKSDVDEIINSSRIKKFYDLHEIIFSGLFTANLGVDPGESIKVSTAVIDELYKLEFKIGEDINLVSKEIEDEASNNTTFILFTSIIVIIVIVMLSFITNKAIGKNINNLQNEFVIQNQNIKKGELDSQLDLSKLSSDFKEIGNLFNDTLSGMSDNIKIIEESLGRMLQGDFSTRIVSDGSNNDYLVNLINNTLDKMPFEEVTRVLNTTAEGDLTVRIEKDYDGDSEKLKNSINYLNNEFAQMIGKIREVADTLKLSGEDLNATSLEMSEATMNQSRQTEQLASGVEEMSNSASENSNLANQTTEGAVKNMEIANKGGEIVRTTIKQMRDIGKIVNKSAGQIGQLNEAGQKIGKATSVIYEIADQTNMLALNAAIEAARAGEQGRGFAVVADEVRKLAEKTTDATKEITDMISNIQRLTETAVKSMEEGTIVVNNGLELADQANDSLSKILENATSVLDKLKQIALATDEQTQTADQMSTGISEISLASQQNADKITGLADLASRMVKFTEELRVMISKFTIENQSNSQKVLSQPPSNKLLK